ncbi:hypothetical protein K488DRAFT_82629 [Vararia minispora EC-137]|uniref:Uncharacterized protein n=1 Tax=Vararia minispora EC-137 TaxID=1314806 RepID=A0ACB8QVJ8_9AGAM|nr:hypothetical protein K488DRAFT_82629 [Vararia minispora EC-137]
MSFQYYQQNMPGWGTSQFTFGSPPPLGYAPLNTWNGLDYYRAHVTARGAPYDPALYQNVVNRALVGGSVGSGLYEAEHWHRRAYGGLGELTRMLPAEIGAAAAYEAWRQFRYNMLQYDYLGPSDARPGRLWQDTGRAFDQYGASATAEAAAATISVILNQAVGHDARYVDDSDAYYHSRRPSIARSYDDDDAYVRGRALSRSPFHGRAYSHSPIPPAAPTVSPISTTAPAFSPIPGTAYSPYGSAALPYGGSALPYGSASPYSGTGYSYANNYQGTSYPAVAAPTVPYASSYTNPSLPPLSYLAALGIVTIAGTVSVTVIIIMGTVMDMPTDQCSLSNK